MSHGEALRTRQEAVLPHTVALVSASVASRLKNDGVATGLEGPSSVLLANVLPLVAEAQ
jgi:hypothetical protein